MKKMAFLFLGLAVCAAVVASGAETQSPYGICAHVTRSLRGEHMLKGTLDAMVLAGIRQVRSDFDGWAMLRKDGTWDFTNYDQLLSALEARGVQLLPIVYGCEKPPADLAKHRDYVRAIVLHYGKRLPVIEIWNEANLNGFFPGADPVAYAEVLKASYEAVKSVDPLIRVAYTGTAGVPFDWIRRTFQAGATNCFDIMCVHPYSHPSQPEGALDVQTEKLRALMAEFGIARKPIWFTEIGWPTHQKSAPFLHILQAGLKTARPEQKTWRAVLAENQAEGDVADQSLAREILDFLPAGSSVVACSQKETVRRLADGEVDAVIYPFDESYPADTAKAVNDFVRAGGVLVDFGGIPCYFGRRDGESVKGLQHGGGLGQFPFGYRAWWTDSVRKTYPKEGRVFATEVGLAAGVKQEPTGFPAKRFLAADRAGKDAEWIPLVAGKATNGTELVAAAVIRYRGDRKGAAVLCSLYPAYGVAGTNTEENQARFTARALAITFAEGVEATFPYALVTPEIDPYYSEHHFGIMHADFTPKPAYSAYGQFIRMRPQGSVNLSDAWHDAERKTFYPQWKRPDGKVCGMIWTTGADEVRDLRFTGGEPTFYNLYGLKLPSHKRASGVYRQTVSASPVYCVGAKLALPDGKGR